MRDKNEKHGYMFAHRKVMEQHLGRKLEKSEVIHHIDDNPLNNDLENLWLTDNINHRKAHISLQIAALKFLKTGLLNFNRETGLYET